MNLKELYGKAESILATLPKAHYLKASTIPVTLNAYASTSYFDPEHWQIVVSFANIAVAVSPKIATLTDEELEGTIRALCYHELSHAMLTPADLMVECQRFYGISHELTNIIEDERIENLLAHYFHGVDFKANARALIQYKAPKSFEEWVLYGLRIRKAPFGLAEMVEALKRFLKKTAKYNSSTSYGLSAEFANFFRELKAIFEKYVPATPKAPQPSNGRNAGSGTAGEESENNQQSEKPAEEEQSEGNEAEDGEKEADENDHSEGNEDGEQSEEAKENGEESEGSEESEESEDGEKAQNGEQSEEESNPMEAEPEEGEEDEGAQTAEESEELMRTASVANKQQAQIYGSYPLTMSDFFADAEAKVGMLKAIIRNKGLGIATAPTIGAYSGKFNVKRYIKDQHLTMKWCDKTLDGGEREARKAEKKTLNIWLDQSGSFWKHDATINGILKALDEIERSRNDFEWRLIRMDDHFVLEQDKSKRYSKSNGDNALPKNEIEATYRATNQTGKELNIVLFDGRTGLPESCLSTQSGRDLMSYNNLKPLDNKRTIFITERSNTKGIAEACPHCREVITENSDYEGRLKANIVRAFDLLF